MTKQTRTGLGPVVKASSVLQDDYILKRVSATGSNYFAWRKTVKARVTMASPNVIGELLADPPVETADQRLARLSDNVQWPAERDERTDFISDEAYARVMAVPAGLPRKRQQDIEVASARQANKLANVGIRAECIIAQQTLKNLTDTEEKKRAERMIMSAALISKEFVSEECLKMIRNHGDFQKGLGDYNSPYAIMEIIKKLFGGSGTPSISRRIEQENILRSMKQEIVPLPVYVESFMDQLDRCEAEGSQLNDQSLLVGLFIWGLNVDVFSDYINQYNDDPTTKPGTLSGVMSDVATFYNSRMHTDPRLRGILEGHESKDFGAFASDEIRNRGLQVIKCQFCGKEKHTAKECFKLLDQDFVDKLYANVSGRMEELEKRKKY
jgi:hypothetical protein